MEHIKHPLQRVGSSLAVDSSESQAVRCAVDGLVLATLVLARWPQKILELVPESLPLLSLHAVLKR